MTATAVQHWAIVCLLVILVIATWKDLHYHKIPNLLSLGGLIIGIAAHGWISGVSGLAHATGGAAVGFAIFLPFYLARGMGAGDVKLMAAAGSFLGPQNALLATGLSLGAGGVIALIILLIRGGLSSLFRRYWTVIKSVIYTKRIAYTPPDINSVASMKFPYAAAILMGTTASLWWTGELQVLVETLLIHF